jgi:hypothetical protein
LSKQKMYHELANDKPQHPSDFIILIYCMKLLMWWPPAHDGSAKRDGRTTAYLRAVVDGPGPGRAFTKSLPSPWIVL